MFLIFNSVCNVYFTLKYNGLGKDHRPSKHPEKMVPACLPELILLLPEMSFFFRNLYCLTPAVTTTRLQSCKRKDTWKTRSWRDSENGNRAVH